MVHGETDLARAERASRALFGEEIAGLGRREIEEVFADVPSSEVPAERLDSGGVPLLDLLVATGLAHSKAEARRAIQGGGVYVNNQRCPDERKAVSRADAIAGAYVVLRKGRKDYHLLRLKG
jgi:tyrosyl-tRNA synthetase